MLGVTALPHELSEAEPGVWEVCRLRGNLPEDAVVHGFVGVSSGRARLQVRQSTSPLLTSHTNVPLLVNTAQVKATDPKGPFPLSAARETRYYGALLTLRPTVVARTFPTCTQGDQAELTPLTLVLTSP